MDMSEPSVGSKSPKLQARALKHRELSFKRRNNIKDEDKLAPVADDTNDRTRSCGGLGHGSAAGESGTQHVRKNLTLLDLARAANYSCCYASGLGPDAGMQVAARIARMELLSTRLSLLK